MTSLLVKHLELATIPVSSDKIKSIVLLLNNRLICIVNCQICLCDINSGKVIATHKNRNEYQQICRREAHFVSIFSSNGSEKNVRISTLKVENGTFVEQVEDKTIAEQLFAAINLSPNGKTHVYANQTCVT